MQTRTKVAVAGATGRAGRHVVDILAARGHEVVAMSRSGGVDVVTGDGLADALADVDHLIDVASTSSLDETVATEYFATATANLHRAGEKAGVRRMVAVSIIGTDKFSRGYCVAKHVHEQAMLAGPIPARILRAAQFHEFVPELMEWGRQGDVSYVPRIRTQLVAARTVAEALVDLALAPEWKPGTDGGLIPEIAGPREDNFVEAAKLLVARRGDQVRIEAASDPFEVDRLNETGGRLPSPHATLAGPTFEEWLDSTSERSIGAFDSAGERRSR